LQQDFGEGGEEKNLILRCGRLPDQVSQLGAGVKDSKATSAVELMGRKRVGQGESLPLGPADPASRILEALLAVDDERERLALLPSAFEPHPEGELPLEVTHQP
jgi:hypothetical protein